MQKLSLMSANDAGRESGAYESVSCGAMGVARRRHRSADAGRGHGFSGSGRMNALRLRAMTDAQPRARLGRSFSFMFHLGAASVGVSVPHEIVWVAIVVDPLCSD